MDILLLAITVISVGVALVMGIAAWGVWKEERARSAARVAALRAAAGDTEPVRRPQAPWPTPVRRQPVPTPASSVPVGGAFLGSAVSPPPSGGRQRGLAIAAGILLAALVAGYFISSGDDAVAPAQAASEAEAAPLELIALGHERKNGTLAISGLVRNPNAGRTVDALNAVVFLFDREGTMLASSRAGVDYTQLTPGGESPFVIRVTAPPTVARYRVSFRTAEGVVAHIDRRGQQPIAREVP